ncbi:MAG: twin-arginine translocase TatA/TatE family subunit [Bacteroidales bacterium]|jgi:sec-independent protein translocase protein TatA|nr:twin-arginine translocase TatA/TatE family subunit [Bacteroidales bacterium]
MLVYPLAFGFWEIVIIALIIILLFGGKKIPELMKGLGKGVRSFKDGMNDVESEIKDIDKDYSSSAKEKSDKKKNGESVTEKDKEKEA